MRALAVLFLLSSSAIAADVREELAAMVAQHEGKVAFYAKNLKTGQEITLKADTAVPTASVIKLPIMIEAFAQVKEGKRRLDEKLTVTKDNQVEGSGILSKMRPGLEITFEDAVLLMIVLSDNTATNMLLDRIGIQAVNARMQKIGMKNTYLYKKVFKPAEGPLPAEQKKFGLGKTTAREMAQVMESISRCDLSDRKLCDRMLEILAEQFYRDAIPRFLMHSDKIEKPKTIRNKTGSLDELRADVAVVETRDASIVISAFTFDNKDQRWTAENSAEVLIGRMAHAVVSAWAPKR
jgi:beta-lactamase class A